MHLFDRALSVAAEDVEIELRRQCAVPWAAFVLNPRRLRGSDFLMRWSQGRWSEERVVQAVNATDRYFAVPYGPSSTAPSEDIHEFELYFERLEQAGLGEMKRPDVLIFRKSDQERVCEAVERLGGERELPFIQEEKLDDLLSRAVIAVECENSLWRAKQMPDYGSELRPMKRLGWRPGLPKNAKLPTVIVKDEDRGPLRKWQAGRKIPIHIWHVFYDLAYGIAFARAERLIKSKLIEAAPQTFQAPGGATTQKNIYKIYYQYAYPLGWSLEEPKLVAEYITDKNGHILPFVRFLGGALRLTAEAIAVLDKVAGRS